MDRATAYPLEETTELDILNTNKFAMIGLGKLALAIIGTGPVLHGLPCTPGAGLTVQVGAGQIYLVEQTDATGYSSLGVDTHSLVKQGLLLDPVSLGCPVPATAGQAINYLIEVGYQDTDTGPVVLPFYNASNPTVAFSGPGGSGNAVATVRSAQCIVRAKGGAAAAIGSQATPAPDAGFVAAYIVTVTAGATGIVAGNIVAAANAPFLAGLLNSHHGGGAGQAPKINLATEVQGVLPIANLPTGLTVWCGTTSGTANAQAVGVPAAILTFPPGSGLAFEIGTGLTNTGAVALTVGSFGTFPVLKEGPTGPIPLTGGEMVAGNDMTARLNAAGTALQLTATELGTAALANASSNTGKVAALSGAFTVGHVAGFSDTNGTLVDLGTPGAAAAATALTTENNGTVIGPGDYLVDTTAGPINVTITSALAKGMSFHFTDQKNTMGTNNFLVNCPAGVNLVINGTNYTGLNWNVAGGWEFLISYDGNNLGVQ